MHPGKRMRIFNNKRPDLPGSETKLSLDNSSAPGMMHPPGAVPPGMQTASSRTALNAFMRNAGNRMGSKLMTMLNSMNAAKTQGSAPSSVADLMRQSHQDSYQKFTRNEAGINNAMAEWANSSETLTHLLKPYINPGSKKAGIPQTDGLRSGVTTLLNGIYKEGSRAPQDLQDAARALGNTPIFKVQQEDGTFRDITLINFATTYEHGTGMLDALDISPEHRKQIAQRVAFALADLRKIGDAYINNGTSAPERRLDSADYVLVSPRTPETTNLKRRNAIRRTSQEIGSSKQADTSLASATDQLPVRQRMERPPRPLGPRSMSKPTS